MGRPKDLNPEPQTACRGCPKDSKGESSRSSEAFAEIKEVGFALFRF